MYNRKLRTLCIVNEVNTNGVDFEIVGVKNSHLISLDEAISCGLLKYAENGYRFHAIINKIDGKFAGICEYELDNRFLIQQILAIQNYLTLKGIPYDKVL